jgi:2'-hydroxyisoflavone reductase
MRLLLIGGSSFLGRATAEAALRRGDEVTTFNRGQSSPDVDGVEALRGDRTSDDDLAQLAGRHFDVVVDTCGFVPEVVGRSVRLLEGSGAHYVYVSSMSAATTWPSTPTPDDADSHPCAPDADADAGDYGVLKAGCERAVTEVFGDRSAIVRSGLIIGPHENVGRLPWWLGRIGQGGEVLAPGDRDVPMQLVDARDLAEFMLDVGSAGTSGTFNAVGPRGNTTFGSWLDLCVQVTGSDARLTWVSDQFLLDRAVAPWTELPLWMPPGQDADHVWDAETAAAERAGLKSRPVADTVRDTWAWMQAGGTVRDAPVRDYMTTQGIDRDKEHRILAEWRARP